MSGVFRKCKKCEMILSEESDGEDGLCDNCNVGLIAQNLVAELAQHEIRTELTCNDENLDSSEIIPSDVLKNEPEEPQFELLGVKKEESDEKPEVITNLKSDSPPAKRSGSQVKTRREKKPFKEKIEQNKVGTLDYDDSEGNNCSDGSDSDKKSDIVKIEPMTTRAKLMQMNQVEVKQEIIEEEEEKTEVEGPNDDEEDLVTPMFRRLTRKTLNEIEKYKHPTFEASQSKARRTKVFKMKPVYKAPTSQARIYSSDYVFYKGLYFQIGDIVAIKDRVTSGTYYAQITNFFTDQYCHKCASIQWLFPTRESPDPKEGFDPRTYFLGYIDETLRPLKYLYPVMRCPSDYYKFHRDPFPNVAPRPDKKYFIWKRLEPISLNELQDL